MLSGEPSRERLPDSSTKARPAAAVANSGQVFAAGRCGAGTEAGFTRLVLGPVAGEAADEELVGGVHDDSFDDLQGGEVHGGVWVGRPQHDAHVRLVVVRPPDLR